MDSKGEEDYYHGNRGAEHLASLLNRAEQMKYEYYCNGIDNAMKVSNKKVRAEAKLVRSRAQWLQNLSGKEGETRVLDFRPKRKKSPDGKGGLLNIASDDNNEQNTFITWMSHKEYSMGSLASRSDVTSSRNSGKAGKGKKKRRHGESRKDKGNISSDEGIGRSSKQAQVTFSEDMVKGKCKSQTRSPKSKDQCLIKDQAKDRNNDANLQEGQSVFLTETLPDIFQNQFITCQNPPSEEAKEEIGLAMANQAQDPLSMSSHSLSLPAIVTQTFRTTHIHPASRIPKTSPKTNQTKTQKERIEEFLQEQQEFNKDFINYQPEVIEEDIFGSDWFLQLMDFTSRRSLPKRRLRKTKYTVYALKRLGISYPEWD